MPKGTKPLEPSVADQGFPGGDANSKSGGTNLFGYFPENCVKLKKKNEQGRIPTEPRLGSASDHAIQ